MTNLVWRWLSHLYWTRGSKSILQMAIILRRTFHLHLFCWPKGLHFKDVDWDVFEHTLMKIVSNEAKEVIKAAMIELHPEKATYMLGTYYVQSVHKWIHQMWIDQSVQDWQKTQRIIASQKYPLPRGLSLQWDQVSTGAIDLWYWHDRKQFLHSVTLYHTVIQNWSNQRYHELPPSDYPTPNLPPGIMYLWSRNNQRITNGNYTRTRVTREPSRCYCVRSDCKAGRKQAQQTSGSKSIPKLFQSWNATKERSTAPGSCEGAVKRTPLHRGAWRIDWKSKNRPNSSKIFY